MGGARRRKLALPDFGEVTRKNISLPGGFQLDLRLTKKGTGTFWKLQGHLQKRLRPGCTEF